jgi:hypothetical protein
MVGDVRRRLAIRAARFGPGADVVFGVGVKTKSGETCRTKKNRGRRTGAIEISLRSLMLFFNRLAIGRIPCNSLKCLALLFSIPNAPACFPSHRFLIPWRASPYTQRSSTSRQKDFSRAHKTGRGARGFIRAY